MDPEESEPENRDPCRFPNPDQFPTNSDNDPNNPVDLTADEWRDIYADMDDPTDFIDHDHSMDH